MFPTAILNLIYVFFAKFKQLAIVYRFQDGPVRIEAASTGTNSTISKIVRMVSKLLSLIAQKYVRDTNMMEEVNSFFLSVFHHFLTYQSFTAQFTCLC